MNYKAEGWESLITLSPLEVVILVKGHLEHKGRPFLSLEKM